MSLLAVVTVDDNTGGRIAVCFISHYFGASCSPRKEREGAHAKLICRPYILTSLWISVSISSHLISLCKTRGAHIGVETQMISKDKMSGVLNISEQNQRNPESFWPKMTRNTIKTVTL